MNNSIITLTSDFGDKFAESQIQLVIDGINPDAKFIVGHNAITPFSIVEGAFIISKFYSFSKPGSIHIGVIDPGVGTNRRGLIIKTKNYWFIGPDNGLLFPAASLDKIETVYSINENKIGSLSNTFHGRDVFAKVAAYLSLSKPLHLFATEIGKKTIKKLFFEKNQAVHIDPYGNVKLSSLPNDLAIGDILTIENRGKKINARYCATFADVKPGQWLLYTGSHQTLELAINLGSAAKTLGIMIEDMLSITRNK
jgi:S-adenosylmethionine hydrolase